MSKPYMTSHEYATALKQLSDEMLACPDFQLGWSNDEVTLGIHASREELLSFAQNLRPLKKVYTDTEIKLSFGSGRITGKISTSRSVVCRVVQPARAAVYECDPLLAPEEEAAL